LGNNAPNVTNLTGLNQFPHLPVKWHVSPLGTIIEFDIVRFNSFHHGISLFHRATERFFTVNALDTILGGEDGNFGTRSWTSGHTYNIRFFSFDHFTIISIAT